MRFLILLLGVFACSTAVIFLKASSWPPIMLAAGRLLAAALLLMPIYVRALKKQPDHLIKTSLRNSIWPALMLGVHFMSWIVGVRMTNATNATLIVNLVPICMPFILFLMIREKPNKHEYISTALAMLGLAIIGIDDFHLSIEHFYGDLVCFGSMITFAMYLALARFYQQGTSIWLYVVPIYSMAGLLCLISSLLFDDWSQVSFSAIEWLYVAALALVPTIMGHSILNLAMRWFRGQLVSVINLSQFVFAGMMAWPLYNETPTVPFLLAALLIVGAAIYLVRHHKQQA